MVKLPSEEYLAIGITGGVACGKSSFSNLLADRLGAERLDTDLLAKEIMSRDVDIRRAIQENISPLAYRSDGILNREWLRNLIFSDPDTRLRLNAIVHPVVRENWIYKLNQCRASKRPLIVEIPLLYEVNASEHFDEVVVVGASPETQIERLISKRGLSQSLATKMLATQMKLSDKVARAQRVIWNDSGLDSLNLQADHLSALFLKMSTGRMP